MFRHWKIQQYWNNSKTPLDKDTANFNPSPCTRKGYTKDKQSASNLRLGGIDTAGGFPFACAKTDRRASVWRRSLYGGMQRPFRSTRKEYAGGGAPLRGDPSAVRGMSASPFPTFCPLSSAFCLLPAVFD
jgi:hypothetical protein